MVDLVLFILPNPVLTDQFMYTPLGVLYLSAICKLKGFSVQIVDLREKIKEIPEAEFYGFSCTTPEITYAKELTKHLKGYTVVGGAHASLIPEDCKFHFNYVIRGEGEYLFPDIMFNKPEAGIYSAKRIEDIDRIPYPDWDALPNPFSNTLFPGERYGSGEKSMTLIGSRGCPFRCAFCGNIFRTPIYYRSVDNIIGEIQELKKRGVYYYRFEDDNFTIHPHFTSLCKELARLGIKYKCHTRSDLMFEEKARLMKLSGCEECGLGVESADNRVLDKVNKKITCSDHKRAIRVLKEAGIRIKTYFVAGLPGETDYTLETNKQFMIDNKPDKWTLSTFTPYPGCDIYNNPEKYGIEIIDKDWSNWWNFVEDHYVHVLTGQSQEKMWQRYLDFYQFLKEGQWQA